MAYLDSETLHTLPVHFESQGPEPASILFPRGPQWTRRYQRTPHLPRLNDCFVYTDQGPPMYRLLGAHYNMYKIPVKTDYHFTDRSCHFELRQHKSPNYRTADTMTEIVESTCENPQFPNWMWRYNLNQKLLRFEPWFTRVERWPPQYRHMGLPDNFRFHPVGANEQVEQFQQLGANFAHDLVANRQAGYGNAALGKTPGPAPPRLIVYEIQNPYPRDELYKVNEVHNLSPGMSLLDHTYLQPPARDDTKIPLNPRQYLELALNQPQAFPGTFPHYNAPIPSVNHRCPRACHTTAVEDAWDPLHFWLEKKRNQEKLQAMERRMASRVYEYLPAIYQPPCNPVTTARLQDRL